MHLLNFFYFNESTIIKNNIAKDYLCQIIGAFLRNVC